MLSPREREKRDQRDSRGVEEIVEEMKDSDGRKRNRNESEKNRRNKNIPPLPLPATRIAGLAQLEANISWMPR